MLSIHRWEFNNEDTARESARWKSAIETLERYGFIEAVSFKRQVFTVTDSGYKTAEQLKKMWSIDTDKNPDEYLE